MNAMRQAPRPSDAWFITRRVEDCNFHFFQQPQLSTTSAMTTYPAYYNVHQGMKAQSIIEFRRGSEASSSSGNKTFEKTSLKSLLRGLQPTDVVQTPAGIYRSIINQGL
jgi:hypothetical protein